MDFFTLSEATDDFLKRTSSKAINRAAPREVPQGPTGTPDPSDHSAQDEVTT